MKLKGRKALSRGNIILEGPQPRMTGETTETRAGCERPARSWTWSWGSMKPLAFFLPSVKGNESISTK